MRLWKKAAKKAAATAAAKLEDEVLSDDPVSDASERKRLDEVIARAQASALPAGDVSRGGEEAGRAVRAAQDQADMAAFIAAHMVRAAAAHLSRVVGCAAGGKDLQFGAASSGSPSTTFALPASQSGLSKHITL